MVEVTATALPDAKLETDQAWGAAPVLASKLGLRRRFLGTQGIGVGVGVGVGVGLGVLTGPGVDNDDAATDELEETRVKSVLSVDDEELD